MIIVKFCCIVVIDMILGCVCVCHVPAGGRRLSGGFGGFGSRSLMIRGRSLMGKEKKNG
jgi:hypothetical protein